MCIGLTLTVLSHCFILQREEDKKQEDQVCDPVLFFLHQPDHVCGAFIDVTSIRSDIYCHLSSHFSTFPACKLCRILKFSSMFSSAEKKYN